MEEKRTLTCEMEVTLKVIGGKWKPLILHYLQYSGPRHYSEILGYLGGAPKKTLAAQLDELERDGIILRTVLPTSPVQVEYSVTELGKTLYPLLNFMCTWGYEHMGGRYALLHPTCSPNGKLLKQEKDAQREQRAEL